MNPPRLAVSLVSPDPPLERQVEEASRAGAELIELRVDRIADADAVERLLAASVGVPIILTIRSADEGGDWDGDDADRIALIERLGLLTPGYVDVEWATWRRSANLRQKIRLVCDTRDGSPGERSRNTLMLSHHDLAGTPANTAALLEELAATPAGVIKAAFTARDARDALTTLDALRRIAPHRPTIALSMGEAGLATRVLARKFGAFLTFACLDPQRASAPGQPTLDELRRVYRWDAIGPRTRVFGVVGWPVGHSRSPQWHNAAMAESGIDGVYLPFPVEPTYEAFREFADGLARADWLDLHGLSVTIPHKEHALRWLTQTGAEITPLAQRCAAVNTLTRLPDGGWRGDNTDASGFARAIADSNLRGGNVLVLGAGGAARAVVVALLDAGARVTVCNRSASRAEVLRTLGCDTIPWESRTKFAADALVNCTSVGMTPHEDATPMPAEGLRSGMRVIDTIYTPATTRLLREASVRGATTIGGEAMFHAQAAEQFALWHHRPS